MKDLFKKMNKLHKGVALALIGVMVTIAAVSGFGEVKTQALPDESVAIKYSEYVATHTIENQTEFIGTYLVHIKAMTDEIYDKAIASQSEYGQYNFYYKNELEDGAWFDIGDAAGIASLSGAEGKRVNEDDMKDLLITCVVDSSGNITGAKTGESMGLYDYPNPYDVSQLPEFKDIKVYSDQYYPKSSYEEVTGDDAKTSAVYIYRALSDFWKIDLTSDITKKADAQLIALDPVYKSLLDANEKEQADILSTLMGKIDATRRAEVYYLLGERDFHFELENTEDPPGARAEILKSTVLGDYYKYYYYDTAEPVADEKTGELILLPVKKYMQAKLDKVPVKSGGNEIKSDDKKKDSDKKDKDKEDDDKKDDEDDEDEESSDDSSDIQNTQFIADSSLNDQLDTAVAACATAYNEYSSNILSDPGTVIGTAEYQYSQTVIDSAEGGVGAVSAPLGNLQCIYNIRDNKIQKNDAELNIINGSLMSQAESKYSGKLSQGVNSEYLAIKAQSNRATAGADIIEQQAADIESGRSELEFLISAKNMRLSPEDALKNTQAEIDTASALYDSIPNDALNTSAKKSLDDHIDWLKAELKRIQSLDDSLVPVIDKMQEQKEDLQDELQDALAMDDMNLVNRKQAQIDALDDAIEKEEHKLNAIINDPNATAGEKAAAEAGLGDTGSAAAAASDDGSLDDLSAGDGSDTGSGTGDGSSDAEAGDDNGSDSDSGSGSGTDDGSGSGSGSDSNADAGSNGDGTGDGSDAGTGDDSASGSGTGTGGDTNAGSDSGSGSGSDSGSGSGNKGSGDSGTAGKDSGDSSTGDKGSGASGGAGSGASAGAGSGAGAGDGAGAGGADGGAADTKKGLDSGSIDTKAALLSEADIESTIEDIIGGAFDQLSDEDMVVVTAAVDKFGQNGNVAARKLAAGYAGVLSSKKNPFIYDTVYDANEGVFISLSAIAHPKVSSYRYGFNASRHEGSMISSGKSYTFIYGSKDVMLNKKNIAALPYKARFSKNVVYIPNSASKTLFKVTGFKLYSDTKHSLVLTDKMKTKADKLYNALSNPKD